MKYDTIVLKPGQTLQAQTEQEGTLQVTAHFADKGAAGVSPGNQFTEISGTGAVDIVDAPSAGNTRMVKLVTLFNNNSGEGLDTTLQINDGGTTYVLDYQTIADNAGFSTNDDAS